MTLYMLTLLGSQCNLEAIQTETWLYSALCLERCVKTQHEEVQVTDLFEKFVAFLIAKFPVIRAAADLVAAFIAFVNAGNRFLGVVA